MDFSLGQLSRSRTAVTAAIIAVPIIVGGVGFTLNELYLHRAVHHHRTAAGAGFAPPPHSVAVMQFTNLGAGAADGSFAAALTARLASVPGLEVTPQARAFAFKGSTASTGEIATSLNVAAVLEGSVRRYDTRLRIMVELTDGKTGRELWSHAYDQDQSETASIEDDLVARIEKTLNEGR
jgi:TolB-like protein